ARRAAQVTARYMAPVSRYSKPRRAANAFAALLLPAPAGPSMVTIKPKIQSPRSKVQSPRSGSDFGTLDFGLLAWIDGERERLASGQCPLLGGGDAQDFIGEPPCRQWTGVALLAWHQVVISRPVENDRDRRVVGIHHANTARRGHHAARAGVSRDTGFRR